MHQLKSIYNSPFKDSHSHPIHTCFLMVASNVEANKRHLKSIRWFPRHKILGIQKVDADRIYLPCIWKVGDPNLEIDRTGNENSWLGFHTITRLHSSRMHTTCLLTISPSMHCTGGAWSQGGSAAGGVPGPRGVPGPGWGLDPGVPVSQGSGIPACLHAEADPLWTEWQTGVNT